MCIWVLIFLFLYLLAYSYTSFKKKTESNIFCGKYIFLISHLFYSPPFQYLLHLSLSVSSSVFESEWFVPRLFFHRIAFIIYRLLSLGTNIFCIICLKTSHLSLVVKLLFVVVILLNWWQTKLLDSYGKADCFGQGEKAPKWECLYLPKDILNITICFSDCVPGKQLDSYQWCFLLVVMDISKINIVLCFLFQSTYVCVKS